MKKLRVIAAMVTLAVSGCLHAIEPMPGAAGQSDMQLTSAGRQQLIDKLIHAVDNNYVFPEVASKAAALLREQQQRGDYNHSASAQKLSATLTHALQAATKDRHLNVFYSASPIPERKPGVAVSPEERNSRLLAMRSYNFGLDRVERLPFNIGYLELSSFAPANEAAETIAAAMTVVAHTDALIIDLRKNSGGDRAAAERLASYFLDKRTHLYDFYYRKGNRSEQMWSSEVVPGPRYGQQKDVFVLTSRDTFSAAEYFADALKNLKRATLIGETTGGGANAGDVIRLTPHFAVFIPLSRPVNPVTKSNWEAIGVAPDVAANAGDALRVAQLAILKKLVHTEKNTYELARLKDHIAGLEAVNR